MRLALTSALAIILMTLIPFDAHADRPTQIAFVDTGNTGRSVMATALAEAAIRKDKLPIAVIGRAVDMNPFFTAPEANAAALLLMHGIDVAGHRAEQLTVNDVRHADLIITMTAKHRDAIVALYPDAKVKTHTLAEYATGKDEEVVDAYGKPMEVYEQVFAQISGYLPAVLEKSVRK
jgi:protein-tyrosine-phosphatase